jgi:hypothetical protein
MSKVENCDDHNPKISVQQWQVLQAIIEALAEALPRHIQPRKQWLSLKAAPKEYVDLSERTLRSFLHHPTHPLPARRVSGKWLVSRQDLDTWLKSFPRAGEDADQIVKEVMTELQRGKEYDHT